MKQSELETLVDHLAMAEEEAAALITDEQAASTARLKQLQGDLEGQFDDAVSALLQQQEADKTRQQQQAELLNRQADQQIQQQTTTMQERHDQYMDSIVNWAVRRIIEP
jgi:hypothetical protein